MLKIYSTQARKKLEFKPVRDGEILMYVCGPTVYNQIHIGNARTFISFDIIRRYLIWKGFKVTFVQNITDVDDKIIEKSKAEGISAAEVAAKYSQLFIEEMRQAGVLDPDIRPRATEEIPEMIDLIKLLVDSGHAYVQDGDVYFQVDTFKGYGSLSGRDVENAETGHRDLHADGQGLEERKRSQADFALWKTAKPGEPSWDSPWGKGRPGWHIECSAMSHKYLGLPFDIHGGGSDLVFPHHENERAQSICAYDKGFANYWMHSGMLQIINEQSGKNEKMSKSLNNFILLHEALEQVDANVLRMLVLQTHYRSPLVFGEKRLEEAKQALNRLQNTVRNLDWKIKNANDEDLNNSLNTISSVDVTKINELINQCNNNFVEAMDDDFNTSKALGEIFNLVSASNVILGEKLVSKDCVSNVKELKNTIVSLLEVFGLKIDGHSNEDSHKDSDQSSSNKSQILEIAHNLNLYDGQDINQAADSLLNARTQARKNKDWDTADSIRDQLANIGVKIEDTPQGPRLVFE